MKKIFSNTIKLILILVINQTVVLGQNLDSLLSHVNSARNDSLKVKHIIDLVYIISYSDFDTAVYYADEGLKLCENKKFPKMEFQLLWLKGISLLSGSNFSQSHEIFIKAEKLAETNGDLLDISRVNNSLGSLHLHLTELSNYDTNENRQAQKYFHRGLEYSLLINDSNEISRSYNNVGITYMIAGEYEKGMSMYQNSLDIELALGNILSATRMMCNMAMYYRDTKEYSRAYNIYMEIIKIHKDSNSHQGLFWAYDNLGELFEQKEEYNKSIIYYRLSLKEAKYQKFLRLECNALLRLSKNFAFVSKFDSAYFYLTNQNILKDSIFSIEQQKIIAEAEEEFDSKKRQHQIELLEKDKESEKIKQSEKDKLNFTIFLGLLLLLLLAIVSVVVFYRNYKQKKRDNVIINNQKFVVEEKNKEILDSIQYAKRLQEAILPPARLVKEWLPKSFILYKPKDIVAGDFYWMENIKDCIYFAVADCTGHGVPGAMVSVVCSNVLNKALIEEGKTKPAELLKRSRELVIERFGRSEEKINDGMDISLCALNYKTGKMQWAGANNPLWIIRSSSNEIEEIRADRQHIGSHLRENPFKNHEVQLNSGDSIYIFSDGYSDQFGGEKGKKYKSANFKLFLLSIQDKDMEIQRNLLSEEFERWKSGFEQIDDVCIMGVRI